MKTTIVAALALSTILFSSCSDGKGKQFLGSWTNKEHADLVVKITKDGDNFLSTTYVNGQSSGNLKYKLAGDVLMDMTPEQNMHLFDKVVCNASSGHLLFSNVEWERTN